MTRYNFYNNLELFHKTREIIQQEEQEKIQEDLNELKHYGTKGQKWGVRKWQNYDGTFNEAGKERYFGKSSKTTESDEDKVGSARSDVKDYLKFRNKMLKQRTRDDLNKWYRDNNKAADKQLLKDAKKVDKQREKMYKNQLKDFYDDPNELVSDLDRMYKIGGKSNEQKIGGLFNKTAEEKAEKEGKKLNYELEKADWSKRRDIINNLLKDEKYKDLLDEIVANDKKRSAEALDRTEEIFNDFDDEEIRNLAIAGITNMKEYGYFPNPTMEDLANNAWFYVYEDGNQGDNTAEYLYATMEKGVKGDELDNLYKKLHVKKDSLDEGVTTLKKNPVLTNVNEKYLKEIVDRKLEQNESDNSSYWHLYAASEGSSNTPSDTTKKNYNEAKDIVKKLDSSCGNGDGWDFLNQAIENLDMSSKELSSMTQADWDRINAEINKLKK